ncbi:Piso0_005581 [Millerozyma farinosa CBS 7064]|uniref:Piso0_005581 protein n=1 Tax=Pichia sorbitophila (strain ATCC MYA-4447 / BCRC 22081 / CBS 7064 / NBRC 10061 / NRRL Y-12695) TaxID=559304 RepID=G8Y2C8_PICSO|nr:Piso0_005581 [Millerozyma farinosa CBS 7064]
MEVGSIKKRNRPTLSCNVCKRRKVKCDRKQPCTSCIKYNVTSMCQYSVSPSCNDHPSGNEVASSNVNASRREEELSAHALSSLLNEDRGGGKENASLHSELETLKDKIRRIEASITVASLSSRSRVNGDGSTPDGVAEKAPAFDSMFPSAASDNTDMDISKNPFPNGNMKEEPFLGYNPVRIHTEQLNFYEGCEPLRSGNNKSMQAFPFSWVAVIHKDKALSGSKQVVKTNMVKKQNKINAQNEDADEKVTNTKPVINGKGIQTHRGSYYASDTGNNTTTPTDNENVFKALSFNKNSCDDIRFIYHELKDPFHNSVPEITAYLSNPYLLGLSRYEKKLDDLPLLRKIEFLMPCKKVIWLLIRRFFTAVYTYVPILDEETFRSEISRLIGEELLEDQNVESVRIEEEVDLAYIGILFVVLRMSYLTALSNTPSINSSRLYCADESEEALEMKYILSHPIHTDFPDVAKECFNTFDTTNCHFLTVMQCGLFLRIYKMLAPESGDGVDVSSVHVLNSSLIQMAYSMGLHRDPDNFPMVYTDPKENNLRRKIWFFLLLDDIVQGVQFGSPLGVNYKYVDSKIPFYSPGNENIRDHTLEKYAVSSFAYFRRFHTVIMKIFDLTLDVKNSPQLKEISESLNDLEIFINNFYGRLEHFMRPYDSNEYKYHFVKILKCKNYMNLKGLCYYMYHILFLHYEKKNDLAYTYFYMKKMCLQIIGDFFSQMTSLAYHSHENFGDGADFILTPILLCVGHRCKQFFLSQLIRFWCTVLSMKKSASHETKMQYDDTYRRTFVLTESIAKKFELLCIVFLADISRFSCRYFFAWRGTKSYSYFLHLFSNKENLLEISDTCQNVNYSIAMLQEIDSFCEDGISKIENYKAESSYYGNFQVTNQPSYKEGSSSSNSSTNNAVFSDYRRSSGSTPSTPSFLSDYQNNQQGQSVGVLNSHELDKLWLSLTAKNDDRLSKMVIVPLPESVPNPQENSIKSFDGSSIPLSIEEETAKSPSVSQFEFPMSDFYRDVFGELPLESFLFPS